MLYVIKDLEAELVAEAVRLEEEMPRLQPVSAEHTQQLNAAAEAFLAGITEPGVISGVLFLFLRFTWPVSDISCLCMSPILCINW